MQSFGSQILPILIRWYAGDRPTPEDWQRLLVAELSLGQQARAFGITAENGLAKLEARSQLFLNVAPEVIQLCQRLQLKRSEDILVTLWQLWLPLAMQLAAIAPSLNRPFIQGLLGGQGTGKTTLTQVLRAILHSLGYVTVGLSLDDLYKTYQERQILQQQDPRLIWRGPPGTHDLALGIEILDQLRQPNRQEAIFVPRFDKSACNGAGDRSKPERVESVDIVLFEGWFVGARPVDEKVFDDPPPPIITPADRQFARDMNERLKDYLPLWERLDRLIVLSPVDYRLSKQWRWQAEQKAIAAGRSGMSKEEIGQFVDYFWRSLHPALFITPSTENPAIADLVIEIDAHHQPSRIYRPGK
jgi:D-glycerate 3-kinase